MVTGADSAGRAWAGRSFESNPWAGDDGSAPAGFEAAVRALREGRLQAPAVLDVLRDARLLVPLVADLAEADHGVHGTADKRAELALPTVAGPDGRRVLPAFSSAAAMAAWNPAARPVPAPARQVALGAAGDGVELVVIDPGSTTQFGLRRGALESLARDTAWTPSWLDAEVLAAFRSAAEGEPLRAAVTVEPGDPLCTLDGAEVRVVLTPVGVDAFPDAGVVDRLRERWSSAPAILRAVDSITIVIGRGRP
ncbi:SseB family protein [uncultured Amnibacterium sp.]|uniref:SseB family protein n=1 Tax=uncultured Amnibacterium sp. TaxID=1631851 RepID=UPI0035CC04E5